jgi:hypothetical protein
MNVSTKSGQTSLTKTSQEKFYEWPMNAWKDTQRQSEQEIQIKTEPSSRHKEFTGEHFQHSSCFYGVCNTVRDKKVVRLFKQCYKC